MKKLVIIFIAIILVSIPLTLFIYFNFFDLEVDNSYVTFNENLSFEYYETIFLEDITKIDNGYIEKNIIIDTKSLGNKSYEFIYYNDNKKYLGKLEYTVVDTTAPLVLNSSSYTIEKNVDFLYENIFCADNYDKRPLCTIKGDYDVTLPGSYNLEFIATDTSGNETIKKITLHIKEKIEKTESTYEPTPVLISDVVEKHKTEETMIGVDVSKWQENINWQEFKDAGVEFAIIRIGYGWEEIKLDEMFWEHYNGAKEVGLDIGVYFYSYADSIDEAVMHANWIIDTLDGIKLDLPISFDWEEWSKFNEYNISLTELNQIAIEFINTIEDAGYKGMNYGSKNYLENIWTVDETTWLAHYTEKTSYEKNYYIWQLTHYGSIPGYDGYLDFNVLYK